MIVSVFRTATFNAAHRLHNPAWSDEKNQSVFGLCNRPNYHGHNYKVIAKVTGPVDPDTGFVIDMKVLKDIMEHEVTGRFDHCNLNLDVEEFISRNPTAENIAIVIWEKMRPCLPANLELSITLFETEKNYVEYAGR